MKILLAVSLLPTLAGAAYAKPITVGSVVASYTASHVFTCATAAEVVAARKHPDLVKGCSFLAQGPYGIVLAVDNKTGVMKIDLYDIEPVFGKRGPRVFTTVSGWFVTKIEE